MAARPGEAPPSETMHLRVRPYWLNVLSGSGFSLLVAGFIYYSQIRRGGLLRLPIALFLAGGVGWLLFKVATWQEAVVLSAEGVRRRWDKRFVAWGDVAQANYVKTWPDYRAFRNGVKLDLRNGDWLFIPDCDELEGEGLLAAIRAHIASVRTLNSPA